MATKTKSLDFSDMNVHDQARIVVSTALTAVASGGAVLVFNGKLAEQGGVMVWLPGYVVNGDGEMNLIGGDDE